MGILKTKHKQFTRKVKADVRPREGDYDAYCRFLATMFFPHLTAYGPQLVDELLKLNQKPV